MTKKLNLLNPEDLQYARERLAMWKSALPLIERNYQGGVERLKAVVEGRYNPAGQSPSPYETVRTVLDIRHAMEAEDLVKNIVAGIERHIQGVPAAETPDGDAPGDATVASGETFAIDAQGRVVVKDRGPGSGPRN